MGDFCEIAVRATPRAKASRVVLEGGLVRVYVTAPADENRANEAIVTLLAKALNIAPRYVQLVRGVRSRDKKIRIVGLSQQELLKRLAQLSS